MRLCRAGNLVPISNTGTSCDEYPFASSAQGGGATVAKIPLYSQLVQGGMISAFYAACMIAPDTGPRSEFVVTQVSEFNFSVAKQVTC